MTISWSNTLTASLGTETVVAQDGLGDYSIEGFIPEVAVFPADVEAVSGVLAFAVREGKKVVPWGGGTQMALGNTSSVCRRGPGAWAPRPPPFPRARRPGCYRGGGYNPEDAAG